MSFISPTTSQIAYTPTADKANTIARPLIKRLEDRWSPEDFGCATGKDSTIALQKALSSGEVIEARAGMNYLTEDEVPLVAGTRWRGGGNWSGVASTYKTTGTTTITYVGSQVAGKAVIRASSTAVGVQPTDPSTRDLQNVEFCNTTVDAGDALDYCIYGVRCVANNNLDRLTVTNARAHAFWLADGFQGVLGRIAAYKTRGKGITLARDTYGWGNDGTTTVDQSLIMGLWAYYCGCDQSGNPYNQFNDVTNQEAEYGIGFFGGRSMKFLVAQANNCSGPGLYTMPFFGPVSWDAGYFEGNGRSSGSTRQWDIWFAGDPSAASYNTEFEHMHLGLTPAVRLTGTQPGRIEAGPKFRNFRFLGTMDADWNRFRVEDSDRSVIYANNAPTNFGRQRSVYRNLDVIGRAVIDTSAGAITVLMSEGIIAATGSSITRTGTGLVHFVMSESFSSARYGVRADACDLFDAKVVKGAMGTGSFDVQVYDSANAASDGPTRVFIEVYGYYS